jgi:cbb3-type cytochrome oxidase cytochrome c subunit
MKGLAPLFLGIFGTFAFSWVGLTVIPNWQIGHLNPQSDEEGTDVYPMPQSGMVARGARVYAANGCMYCHSQQVRAEYSADDIERKWGDRRSAPRDYIFERPVFLAKMRMGQDLANIGARAPAEQESPPPAGAAAPATSPAPSPAPSGASPAPAGAASPSPAGSPAAQGVAISSSPPPATSPIASPAAAATSPTPQPTGSPSPASSPAASPAAAAATSPAPNASPTKPTGSPPPAGSLATSPSAPRPNESPASPVAAGGSPAPASAPWPEVTTGEPPMYSAAWHHVHLYSPRSINVDSVMPSYRFLYQTRRISDAPSAEALHLTGSDAPRDGWEIVPTFDAKCLVAYLMSLNQSHPLKEVRSGAPAAAGSPAPSPAPAK